MEHSELVEGAFVNYLTLIVSGNPPATVWPDGLNIYPGENNVDKDGQRIVCFIEGGEMGEEDPPMSGNRWCDCTLQLRTPFSKLTKAQKEAGEDEVLDSHKAAANALQTAALSETLELQLTAAIDDFRCFGVTSRTPIRDQQDNAWVSGWKIKLLSCPSAIAD